MKIHPCLPLLLGVTLAFLAPAARAADRASIHAILVAASNESGESDRRLASYEPVLRRVLRFQSYKFLGEGTVNVAVPGDGQCSLGRGHSLEISAEGSDGRMLRLKINWRGVMNTGLQLRPGVPAVLGGSATGERGEVYAVILVGR